MLRYIAFSWNNRDRNTSQLAQSLIQDCNHAQAGWQDVLEAPGLRVLCANSGKDLTSWVRLYGDSGVIIGTLFERQNKGSGLCQRVLRLSEDASELITRSGGRRLITSYWGTYVAVLSDREAGAKCVLRAPLGSLPCFHTRFRELSIFFSRMEDCLTLGIKFSFNWDYISAHVALNALMSRETALNEVTEIKSGECYSFQGTKVSTALYWNPGEIAASPNIEDVDTAAELVRDAAESCTQALAAAHPNSVLMLSGGLDSTVVSACLKNTGTKMACVNCYADGSNSDERYFARLAAKCAELPYFELQRRWNLSLDRALNASRTAIIYDFVLRLDVATTVDELSQDRQIGAIFTGNGGDEIFHRTSVAPATVDFLRQRGARLNVARTVLSDALLQRISVWRVLRQVASHFVVGSDEIRRRQRIASLTHMSKTRLLNPDLLRSLDTNPYAIHPWLSLLGSLPPGKLSQILALSGRGYDNPFAKIDSPEIVDPLLSQPLVELCLRIPTYIHTSNGVSRAVVRKAFDGLIPSEIAERTTKGGINEHHKRILTHNIAYFRDVLLNGALVSRGLLNRSKLEEALSAKPTRSSSDTVDVTALFSTELWLQMWSRSQKAAAA